MLVDIAQRGRSLGILLVGAQQTASRVASEVLENAAIRVSGRLDAAEAERAEYGWMLPSTRARARLLKPGTMVLSQPAIPVPLVVTFPFPPVGHPEGGSGDGRRRRSVRGSVTRPATPSPDMKILHTSDWHIGKRLGRHDRMDEFVEVLAEVERIADEHAVDLVLVSGDVWDRPIPPMDALTLGLQTLLRLGERRPVVALAGNHDSPELFEALAPLLRPRNVFLTGTVKRPDEGGLFGPEALGVAAVVASFPFLREGRVVDFMKEAGEWYGEYAGRVAGITSVYNEALVARAGADLVPILMAHFLVSGVRSIATPRAASASSTWAMPTPRRRRRSPLARNTSRWDTSTRRRRCRARRSPPSTPARCWRSTSAKPASRSAS